MIRDIQPKLEKLLKNRNDSSVLIIEGARQVGKSYLVNNVLSEMDIPYVSFDLEKDSRVRRQIDRTRDFNDFKIMMQDSWNVKANSILFIDEAQESIKLASYIKAMKEDWPGVKIILTGSSMNRLFKDGTRIPVGRMKSLCVYPFNFTEFLRYTGKGELADFILDGPISVTPSRHELLLDLYDEYLKVGGYPEVVKAFTSGSPWREEIDEIISELEEDFSRKEEFQPYLFSDVLRAVSSHIGSLSKYSHIDTSKYNARKVIEAMKLWHIVLEVPHYSLETHRTGFLPKRYLHDLGVVQRKRVLAAPSISILETIDPVLRTPLGGLFENAVLLNLLEGSSAFKTISTWKKGSGSDREVDFILEAEGSDTKIPIECKAALHFKKKHGANVAEYLDLTSQSAGVVVSASPFEKITTSNGKTIFNIPVYLATRRNIEKYVSRALDS